MNKIKVIDTNVIVRFLTKDNKEQNIQAVKWFKDAQNGKFKILVKPIVVAEACFVLESFYKFNRNDISEKFEVFLSQKWLMVENRNELIGLFPFYNNNFHFVDSYLLAWAKRNRSGILTFDKKVKKSLLQ